MTEVEIAWLAGLLEGEGCFALPAPSEPNSPRLIVSMTDQDIIERVAGLFGVKYVQQVNNQRRNPGWKANYVVKIKGNRACEVMRLVYPHLGERRRARIDQILAGHNTKGPARKLTLEQARAIKLARGGIPCRELARRFGVSRDLVYDIWSGKLWARA